MQNQFSNLDTKIDNLQNEVIELKRAQQSTQEELAKLRNPRDCADVFKSGLTASDVYTVNLAKKSVRVYCDMDTDNGGGWTVFQRRSDGSVDFYQPWTVYQAGFGDLTGEYWWGLENLATITSTQNYTLRVEMSDFNGNTVWAEYREFSVAPEADNYRVSASGYSGTAGRSLVIDMQFSTYDNDNDLSSDNCAVSRHAAFWYNNCGSNPNGIYHSTATENYQGVTWFSWKRSYYSMRTFQMLLRPADYV